jgi:hypothetical protein
MRIVNAARARHVDLAHCIASLRRRAAGDRRSPRYDAGAALRSDQTRERYALPGVEPISSTPEGYSPYIAAEIATWKKGGEAGRARAGVMTVLNRL